MYLPLWMGCFLIYCSPPLCMYKFVSEPTGPIYYLPCSWLLLPAHCRTWTTELFTPGLNDYMKSWAGLDYLPPWVSAPFFKRQHQAMKVPVGIETIVLAVKVIKCFFCLFFVVSTEPYSTYANIATVCSQSSCMKLYTPNPAITLNIKLSTYCVLLWLKQKRRKTSLHLSMNQ